MKTLGITSVTSRVGKRPDVFSAHTAGGEAGGHGDGREEELDKKRWGGREEVVGD